MMDKFKIGDLVRLKSSNTLIGKAIGILQSDDHLHVQWFEDDMRLSPYDSYVFLDDLEPAENPIQRMKRLYSEEER